MTTFRQEWLSRKLVRRYGWREVPTITHWCPACNEPHDFAVSQPFSNGAIWTWDNDLDKPTFQPSMHIKTGPYPDGSKRAGQIDICHYYLVEGVLKYLTDCTHAMKGTNVALPNLPYRSDGKYMWFGSTVVDAVPPDNGVPIDASAEG